MTQLSNNQMTDITSPSLPPSPKPPLLASLSSDGWKLGEIKPGKSMKIATITYDAKVPAVRLAESIELRIPFAPSCFGGADGDRKGCIIAIPQETADVIIELEEFVINALKESTPNIMQIWTSSVKPSEKYPPSLRCKINTGGTRKVKYFNEDLQPCSEPNNWQQLPVNVCIAIRGVYIQKNNAGLLLDITHLQYAEVDDYMPF